MLEINMWLFLLFFPPVNILRTNFLVYTGQLGQVGCSAVGLLENSEAIGVI